MKQVLTFTISNELYCYDILNVVGIDQVAKITPVPLSPNYLLGVMNLRGQIIPVLDLRKLFEKEISANSKESCVVFVDTPRGRMGCLVDGVRDVIELGVEAENPDTHSKVGLQHQKEGFINSVFKFKEELIFFLNADKIFDSVGTELVTENKIAA